MAKRIQEVDSILRDLFGSACGHIEQLLEAEDVKQFGPIEPSDDLRRLMYSRDAGYLIGVQVGLRLREVR